MVIIINTLQLPPELSREEIEKIPEPQPTTEEEEEEEQLQRALRLSLEAGKIRTISSVKGQSHTSETD